MTTDVAPWKQRGVHESTALLRLILRISEEFTGYMGEQLTVNPTDLAAMQHLIMDGPMSPTQLARKLKLSTAAATVVVDRLTKVGHVTRAPHPSDRRGIIIQPAEESVAKAMHTLMPMIMGIDRVIHDFSPEEQETITRYLRNVVEVYRGSLPPSTEPSG
jgi:DNA-binding MarR family transcriptional regulator